MKTPDDILQRENVRQAWLALLQALTENGERLLGATLIFADPEPHMKYAGVPLEVKFR